MNQLSNSTKQQLKGCLKRVTIIKSGDLLNGLGIIGEAIADADIHHVTWGGADKTLVSVERFKKDILTPAQNQFGDHPSFESELFVLNLKLEALPVNTFIDMED